MNISLTNTFQSSPEVFVILKVTLHMFDDWASGASPSLTGLPSRFWWRKFRGQCVFTPEGYVQMLPLARAHSVSLCLY